MRGSLVSYLAAKGWEQAEGSGAEGALWRKPGSRFAVPVPFTLDDESPDWELILSRLSRVEQVSEGELRRRVRDRLIDVGNLRAARELVIEDTIPLEAGVSMVRDSWAMLRSCATTSLGARPHIGGNYRPSGDHVLSQARMAHTRRGSFIIPVYLPLPEPVEEPDVNQLPNLVTAPAESPERRLMRTFAESLSIVESVVESEFEPTSDDLQDMIQAGVSHEFTSGLHRILRNESVGDFTAEFEWAVGGGPVPRTVGPIQIPAVAAERVDRVSRTLKLQRPVSGTEVLTGPIVAVQRDAQDTGGSVTIQTVRNARQCHVSVNVSRERLDLALDWMKLRATAVIRSRVHRVGPDLFAETRDSIVLLAHEHLLSQ